jgi:predicted ATPase
MDSHVPFLRSVALAEDAHPSDDYLFTIPAIAALSDGVELAPVTLFVGENGSGKSTLVEAIAVIAGFNPEGGSRTLRFSTMGTHSDLSRHLEARWTRRPARGWFLRAETFYGMATHIAADDHPKTGIASLFPDLHARSHGEAFLALIEARFAHRGMYVMDEPESALSFRGQLALLRAIHDGLRNGSQFVISTHSPLLMRMPGAELYQLDGNGIDRCAYDDLAVVNLWRRFLSSPDAMLDALLADGE